MNSDCWLRPASHRPRTKLTLTTPHRTLLLLLCLVTTSASAQMPEPWPLPGAREMAAIAPLCAQQARSIIQADQLRRQGRTREEVLALIPAEPEETPPAMRLRLLEVMRENVEDVFNYRELFSLTIYQFRWAVCAREVLTARRAQRLRTVLPKVVQCQARSLAAPENKVEDCIGQVVANELRAAE